MFSFLMFMLALVSDAHPEDLPADAEIVVEAHQQIEVFVMPAEIIDTSDNYSVTIDDDMVFGYASIHAKLAKVPGDVGYVNVKDDIMIYNSDTIKYVWDNCNYSIDAFKCASQNNHWLLHTKVVVTDHQITISMYVYDELMQIRNTGSVSSTYKISYISRPSPNPPFVQQPGPVAPINACLSPGSCQNISTPTNPVPINQNPTPQEPEPTKVEVHPKLLKKDIHQASLRTWVGLKLY